MTYDYHVVLGFLSVVVGIAGYAPYFRDIFAGKTKPHVFSWFVFGLLNMIVFFGQITRGGGPGALAAGITVVGTFAIALLALQRGEKHITPLDWTCFAGALLGTAMWAITKEPLIAVLIATITDVFAFAPTFRKSFWKPHEETISTYILSTGKYVLGIFALGSFSVTTVLFPFVVSALNLGLVAILVIRRRELNV